MDHGSIRLHDDECCREAYPCPYVASPALPATRGGGNGAGGFSHFHVARLPHHHSGRQGRRCASSNPCNATHTHTEPKQNLYKILKSCRKYACNSNSAPHTGQQNTHRRTQTKIGTHTHFSTSETRERTATIMPPPRMAGHPMAMHSSGSLQARNSLTGEVMNRPSSALHVRADVLGARGV